jgi:hypothetical protein
VEFEFNFKHTITVADQNTGENLGQKQLWLYRVDNSEYPNQSNFLYELGGCLTSRGVEQWQTAVLEAGQTYDIVTGRTGDGAPLCAAQAAMKNDPLRQGAWQSRLYLCFASATGYKYGYGETEAELEEDLAKAKNDCNEQIKSAAANKSWDTVGSNDVLATSNAIIIYDTAVRKK